MANKDQYVLPGVEDLDVRQQWELVFQVFRSEINNAKLKNTSIQKVALDSKFQAVTLPMFQGFMGQMVYEARGIPVPQKLSGRKLWEKAKSLRENRSSNAKRSTPRGKKSFSSSSAKQKSKAKPKFHTRRNFKQMPDPGNLAWLGSVEQWCVLDDQGKEKFINLGDEWMFLWSKKQKAVVCMPESFLSGPPASEVTKEGGAASIFKVFMDRPAKSTISAEVPRVPLISCGKRVVHIIYVSDKWSERGETTRYKHKFKGAVNLFAGPDTSRPQVYFCAGGKMTITKRGLVW